ncbi:MAG: radical SAM protein, partial [Clostridiales bacterium]|nr:radical SAM protein [Clostridiales bacterium]
MNKFDNRSVSVLIKPSSGLCNLRCRYCFYNSPELNPNTDARGFMKKETAGNLIKRAYEYATEQVVFAFQGGEPTLCGLDFYRDFVEMAKKHNTNKIQTSFSIQTNGMAIDREWARFLAKNKFLTGLSIDGPSRVHNENRIDANGHSSLKKVMETKKLFDEFGVEYNALCVVTSETAKYSTQVYEFFKRQNIQYIQYIPCLDPLGE